MQITETSTRGLKRTLQVVVAPAELDKRFTDRLDEMKDRVQLKGFRKGKVPVTHLKKMYGRSLMVEVLQETVRETSDKAIDDRKERPALQPKVELAEERGRDRARAHRRGRPLLLDDVRSAAVDRSPTSALKLERLVADVDDAAVDKALWELVERNTTFQPEDGRAAGEGDRVTVDFVGKIDGEAFEGGTAEEAPIVSRQGQLHPRLRRRHHRRQGGR